MWENCGNKLQLCACVFSVFQLWFDVCRFVGCLFPVCIHSWCLKTELYVVAVETRGARRNVLSLSTVLSLALLNAWWPYCVRATVVNGMHYFSWFFFVLSAAIPRIYVCFSVPFITINSLMLISHLQWHSDWGSTGLVALLKGATHWENC